MRIKLKLSDAERMALAHHLAQGYGNYASQDDANAWAETLISSAMDDVIDAFTNAVEIETVLKTDTTKFFVLCPECVHGMSEGCVLELTPTDACEWFEPIP